MINIGICDDDKILAIELEKLINEIDSTGKHSISIFTSSKELVDRIDNNNYKCDILFMDIELEDETMGTNIAVELKRQDPNMIIVFISSFECYYETLVQAEPFRFLKKPITKNELSEVLKAAYERLGNSKLEYVYDFNGQKNIISLGKVAYIYSLYRKIYIHFKTGEEIYFYKKLDEVEQEINEICNYFGRVNKSYLVNISSVTKFKENEIYIDELILPISAIYKDNLFEKLIDDRLGIL